MFSQQHPPQPTWAHPAAAAGFACWGLSTERRTGSPAYGDGVTHANPPDDGRVRAAEVISGLSLATDLGTGLPLEHGLESTLLAMRLADRLNVDDETAMETYYGCLLFYIGCTTNADLAAELFMDDNALTKHATAVRFGSRPQMIGGLLRAVAPPGGAPWVRAGQFARGVPRLLLKFPGVVAAICEVGRMLTARLGLPPSVSGLFAYVGERWDGKGDPSGVEGEGIPLAVRIVHVARDAAFQRMLGGWKAAAETVRERAGGAFDPDVARQLADDDDTILSLDEGSSAWKSVVAAEPKPWLWLEGEELDRALHAMGDFADLVSPHLTGHSKRVADLVAAAARQWGLAEVDVTQVRRAGFVHDLGRVAVPARVWHQDGPLHPDDWEQVRLHAYHTERVMTPSSFLARVGRIASFHHERLDGSGYHRGASGPALDRRVRVLAAADVYQAMREPRAHREPLSPEEATEALVGEADAGRLDPDAVTAVLTAAGEPTPSVSRPAGLTVREVQVISLLARGRQTKQIARELDISPNTADHHIQHAYRKIGVSTRAAATLFAMEHGLVAWRELAIDRPGDRQ